MSSRPRLPRFLQRLAVTLAAVTALGVGARGALAADPVPLEQAEKDVKMLLTDVKDDKKGNEDLIGSIGAIQAEFFNLVQPPEPPAAPPDPADPAAVAAHAAAVKAYKEHPERVKTFQKEALDALFKALRVVEYNPRNKENTRNQVNLSAARALGEILGSPDLAKFRETKEVAKLRSDRARDLQGVITADLGKPKGNKEYDVPVDVLEAAFAAVGRTNDLKSLDWLREEYIHTRNGRFEEERLVAAHKAMKLFLNVPAKTRFDIVDAMITLYGGAEAKGTQQSGSTAAERAAAQAAKAFWDKIKTGVIEVINYYATAPGGGPPVNAEGQGYTTIKELNRWLNEHKRMGKDPWVDPPKELSGASNAATKDAPK